MSKLKNRIVGAVALGILTTVGTAVASTTFCGPFPFTNDKKCPSGFANPFVARGFGNTVSGVKGVNAQRGTVQGAASAETIGVDSLGNDVPSCRAFTTGTSVVRVTTNCTGAVQFRMIGVRN